jgi:hypothetical protein
MNWRARSSRGARTGEANTTAPNLRDRVVHCCRRESRLHLPRAGESMFEAVKQGHQLFDPRDDPELLGKWR